MPSAKRLMNSLDKIKIAPKDEADEISGNFIWEAMQDAYDPHTNSVRDLKVDDRDLALAENYFHFCGEIAGKSIKMPFARQLWIAASLFGEYCPRCTKPKWWDINNVPVDMDPRDLAKRLALTVNGICPYCDASRAELILSGDLRDINQGVLVLGQRSGKSAFTATASAYHTHRLLKAPRLSTICPGIQEFTPLTGTFVGVTAARAIKLLWNPFTEIVKNSVWFEEYFAMLRHYGNHYGKEFYKEGGLFYRFFHRNLDYYPMGPQKRTLRGDTRVLACVDELGWFPYNIIESSEEEEEDEREHANGDEVYEALDKSLLTARTEILALYKKNISTIPTGLGMYISSPKSKRDKISRLLVESENPEALALGLRLPTWGVNPHYTRDHPIIQSAYAKNPSKAERDYGANPPNLDAGIFGKEQVSPLFRADIINSHRILYDSTDPNSELTFARAVKSLLVEGDIPAQILTLDAGLTNNAFALAAGHRDGSRLKVTTLLEVVPKPGTNIHYPTVYERVIKPLITECNIGLVGADRWNSINLLQQIEDDSSKRVKAIQFTMNSSHMTKVVTGVATHDILLPTLELEIDPIMAVRNYKKELRDYPVSHLFLQLCTVRELRGSLTKGEGFTDDLFRAVALLYTLTFNSKVKERMDKLPSLSTRLPEGVTRSAVIVAGRSGGGYIR